MKFIIPFLLIANLAYGQLTSYPSLDSNYNYITHFEFNSLFNINPVQNGDTIYSINKYTTPVILGETYPKQIAGEAEDYFITITDLDSTYCIPPFEDYSGAKIEDFKLGDIQNCNSGYDELTYYIFYPDSIFTTDLEIGKTYRILISEGTNAGVSIGITAYIDFNNNFVFDSNEKIIESGPYGPGILDTYITIPNDTGIIGKHRLRARINYWQLPDSPCSSEKGETEDYIVNMVPQDTNEIITPDWEKIIHLPNSQGVYDIKETYDNGYIIALVEGTNMSEMRLIKLSIDGDTLWTKFPPLDYTSYPLNIDVTDDGGFIICGSTYENDSVYGEPYVLKLNACGVQQWKNTYGNANNYDYASNILQTSDSNYVVLVKYLSLTSRIALFKLDSIGNILWQNDYTHHDNSEPGELIETSDKGFLITGYTYTPNPGDSSVNYVRTMVIKVDSLGNEQWEKVLGIDATTVSYSFTSVELETGGFLVTTSVLDPPNYYEGRLGVYRIDKSGNLDYYKTVSNIPEPNNGRFIYKMGNNKYSIVSGIFSGCSNSTSSIGLYLIDSGINVLDSAFVYDDYLVIQGAIVTENNKLVVSGSKKFPNDYDIFMYKFNQDLDFDTLYNLNLNYDSICDITIYTPELSDINFKIDLYPNPACEGINIQINEPGKDKYLIEIISVNGSVLKREFIQPEVLNYISLNDLNSGSYIIIFSQNDQYLSSRKIIISR